MALKTINRHGIEKLDPPTTVAGQVAEVAYVTRFFTVDTETAAETEYGTPIIEAVWGKTASQVVSDLAATQVAVKAEAAATDKQLEDFKTAITKS